MNVDEVLASLLEKGRASDWYGKLTDSSADNILSQSNPAILDLEKIQVAAQTYRRGFSALQFKGDWCFSRDYGGERSHQFHLVGCHGVLGPKGRLSNFNPSSQAVVAQATHTFTHADATFFLGDNVYSHGLDADYIAEMSIAYETLNYQGAEHYAVLGNHDIGIGNAEGLLMSDNSKEESIRRAYRQVEYGYCVQGTKWRMPNRYYMLETEHACFYCIDSSAFVFDQQQQEWLRRVRGDTARQNKWQVLVSHHPLISISKRNPIRLGSSGVKRYANKFDIPLEADEKKYDTSHLLYHYFNREAAGDSSGFDLVFSAHDHFMAVYDISLAGRMATQVISGGGGAKLNNIDKYRCFQPEMYRLGYLRSEVLSSMNHGMVVLNMDATQCRFEFYLPGYFEGKQTIFSKTSDKTWLRSNGADFSSWSDLVGQGRAGLSIPPFQMLSMMKREDVTRNIALLAKLLSMVPQSISDHRHRFRYYQILYGVLVAELDRYVLKQRESDLTEVENNLMSQCFSLHEQVRKQVLSSMDTVVMLPAFTGCIEVLTCGGIQVEVARQLDRHSSNVLSDTEALFCLDSPCMKLYQGHVKKLLGLSVKAHHVVLVESQGRWKQLSLRVPKQHQRYSFRVLYATTVVYLVIYRQEKTGQQTLYAQANIKELRRFDLCVDVKRKQVIALQESGLVHKQWSLVGDIGNYEMIPH